MYDASMLLVMEEGGKDKVRRVTVSDLAASTQYPLGAGDLE